MLDIDVVIFEFIPKLSKMQFGPAKNKPDLNGNDAVMDLGEVQNFGVGQLNPEDGSTISRFVDVDGTLTGLDQEGFAELKLLVSGFLDKEPFASLADAEFLADESFKWLINVYKNQKAETNLTNYLLYVLEKSVSEHRFYFRVKPLEIEERFFIADVEFIVFTDEDIQQLYEQYKITNPNTTFERFNKVCEKNFALVNASVKTKGVFSRAEEEAMRKAELAVDALKCVCVGDAMQYKVQVFDLDYRLQRRMTSFYLTHARDNVSNLTTQIRNEGEVVPISLTKQKLEKLKSNGLLRLSSFIQLQKQNNELYDEIIGLIHQLGTIVSTSDNYEKVVKMISLFESFLVPKDSNKTWGQTRLRIAVPKLVSLQNEREQLMNYIPVFYNVRDRYLHNYKKLPLNVEQLMFLLNFARVLILKLIHFNKTMTTIKEVHDYLGIENK